MTPALVTEKVATFEMSRKLGQEASLSSKQNIVVTCDEHKKVKKGKQVESSSSLSSSEDHDEEDDDEEDNQDEASTSSDDDAEEVMQRISDDDVVVDSCTNEVAMENEVLKEEVDRLTKDLIMLKGKSEQA
jgi:hypothetical protein